MKNNLSDVNNYSFEQLERLNIGKIVTIPNKILSVGGVSFEIEEDDRFPNKWRFDWIDIEYALQQKHFKSLPNNYTGIIELENGIIQEKEILDEAEKRYLKAVIRPFKDKINYISKRKCYDGDCYICIDLGDENIVLPYFKKETMYNGMEENKEYILKELGLDV